MDAPAQKLWVRSKWLWRLERQPTQSVARSLLGNASPLRAQCFCLQHGDLAGATAQQAEVAHRHHGNSASVITGKATRIATRIRSEATK